MLPRLQRKHQCSNSFECFKDKKCVLCSLRWLRRVQQAPSGLYCLVDPSSIKEKQPHDASADGNGCTRSRSCYLDRRCQICAAAVTDYLCSLKQDSYDALVRALDSQGFRDDLQTPLVNVYHLALLYERYKAQHAEKTLPQVHFEDDDGVEFFINCLVCGNTSGAQCMCQADAELFR